MNDIINWVALNNTLMIRIGFSAVVLLLVVYAFRFFFMPSASVVTSESSTKGKDSGDMHIEELAELQGEIDALKAKLKELQNSEQKEGVAATTATAAVTAGAGLETVNETPVAAAPPAINEVAANELKEKLKTLEARLAEYEIIAEEIAEIGKLRVENQKLKEMLASGPVVPQPVAVPEVPVAETAVEEPSGSDSEVDALLGAVDEKTTADGGNLLAAADAEAEVVIGGVSVDSNEALTVSGGSTVDVPEKDLFIIHSEVEVTEEEKELINSFEQFKKV